MQQEPVGGALGSGVEPAVWEGELAGPVMMGVEEASAAPDWGLVRCLARGVAEMTRVQEEQGFWGEGGKGGLGPTKLNGKELGGPGERSRTTHRPQPCPRRPHSRSAYAGLL